MDTICYLGPLCIHLVPKVASTSIRLAITGYMTQVPDNPHRFAVIRHPVDRTVSCWSYFTQRDKKITGPLTRLGVHQGMTLDAFLDLTLPNTDADPHIWPQSRFIEGVNELVPLPHLAPAWDRLAARFPKYIRAPIQVANATRAYETTEEQRQRILSTYAQDLETYERAERQSHGEAQTALAPG